MNPIEWVFDHAANTPEDVAIAAPNFEMTFGNLVASVQRFSGKFQQLGVRKGSIVGVSARAELDTIVALSLLQIGAISLTASASVVRSYRDQIDFLVVTETVIGFPLDRQILVNQDFLQSLGMVSPLEIATELQDEDVVRLVFSSGTTGTPKGVEFTKENLVTRTQSARTNWMPADPFMSLLGLDTVTGMQTFYWSVFNGKTWLSPTSPEGNLELISKYLVKAIKTSPAKLDDLLGAAEANPLPLVLEFIEVAGSLLSRRIGERCQKVTGITPLYLYGSTEVGTVTKGYFNASEPENVGRKVDDVDFEVIEGRIRYRKANMPKDYWLNPNTGSSGFHDGWFYPGDLGRLDDEGNLHLSGRADDLVNAGGAKFNLLELDMWLRDANLFDDVATFTFLNDGGEQAIGIAFVSNQPPIPEILTKRIQDFLPNLNPALILRLKELPRNKLDKVDRKAIQELATTLK